MAEHHRTRKSERKLAAQFLYTLEYMECHSVKELEHEFTEYLIKNGREYNHEDFSWELLCGVWAKQKEIDAKISQYAQNWKIERIGKVELIALRIAIFELLYSVDIAKSIVIKEALEIVKAFGDTHANSFIIGIIEQIAKENEV